MNSIKKILLEKWYLWLILAILIFTSSNLNWGGDRTKGILKADAHGYYAYLPALFIYQDLNFEFAEKAQRKHELIHHDYRNVINGQITNRYYIGTAVMQAPFFLMAHFLSYLSNSSMDGYSSTYMIGIHLGSLFYIMLGLYFLDKLLEANKLNHYYKILILSTTVFGTHLFYYIVKEPGMSHVYSFALTSAFFYLADRFFRTKSFSIFSIAIIVLALIVLVRPVNILVVCFIPFLAINTKTLKDAFQIILKKPSRLSLVILGSVSIIFIQLLWYKISLSTWWVYSYGEDGFNFLEPHFFDILFSYRKGLFLYTPLLFIVFVIGNIILLKKNVFQFISGVFAFCLVTYILSSWSNWWYGGSFSARPYIEYLPYFVLLFAISLQQITIRHKKIVTLFVICIILFCQIQTWQYRAGHIHWSEMTKEKYWESFMRVDRLL